MDSDDYPALSRRILGAKGRFYSKRGSPKNWEIKSTDFIKPNPWKRAGNRNFCSEVARLLGAANATCFTVSIDKTKMNHPMTLQASMPLQLQALVEHFDAECRTLGRVGMVRLVEPPARAARESLCCQLRCLPKAQHPPVRLLREFPFKRGSAGCRPDLGSPAAVGRGGCGTRRLRLLPERYSGLQCHGPHNAWSALCKPDQALLTP